MALISKSTVLKRAEEMAALVAEQPTVQKVLLFGSTARYGMGSDVDIVVVTDELTAWGFLSAVDKIAGSGCGYLGSAWERRDQACKALGLDPAAQLYTVQMRNGKVVGWVGLDIFLFPPQWRQYALLQELISRWTGDPNFLTDIQRHSRRFLPERGEFEGMTPLVWIFGPICYRLSRWWRERREDFLAWWRFDFRPLFRPE